MNKSNVFEGLFYFESQKNETVCKSFDQNFGCSARQKTGEKHVILTFNSKDESDIYLWENEKSPFEKKVFTSKKRIIFADFSFDDKKLLVSCENMAFILNIDDFKRDQNEILVSEGEFIEKGLFSWIDYTIFLHVNLNYQKNIIKVINGETMTLNHIFKFENCQFFVEPSTSFLILYENKYFSIYNPFEGKEAIAKTIFFKNIPKFYYVNKKSDLRVIYDGKVEIYFNFMKNSTLFLEIRDNFKCLTGRNLKEKINYKTLFMALVFPFNFFANLWISKKFHGKFQLF